MEASPASHTPAHVRTATVAPFRAWRSSQLLIAGGPTRSAITAWGISPERGRIFHKP